MNDRRYVTLDLPGETVVLDVPAVPPTKRWRMTEPSGHVVNMIYATAEDMKMFRNDWKPEREPGA